MGLFGLFEKKNCSICGGEIKLMGNTKVSDGNICKECVAKLSPYFKSYKNATVASIQEQLEYREKNKAEVDKFHATRTLGLTQTKIHIDEDNKTFCVTSASVLKDANPDIIPLASVTGVEIEIDDRETEEKTRNAQGEMVSYVPKKVNYYYDFYCQITVNHPYFNTIRFKINKDSVKILGGPVKPVNPGMDASYRDYQRLGNDIKNILMLKRGEARKAETTVVKAVTCPCCGATTTPDASGCCEYCGSSVNQ